MADMTGSTSMDINSSIVLSIAIFHEANREDEATLSFYVTVSSW